MQKITKEMMLTEVLSLDENLIPVFFAHGLHCLGCAMAHHETLEQASMVHGLDLDRLLDDLNKVYEQDLMNGEVIGG